MNDNRLTDEQLEKLIAGVRNAWTFFGDRGAVLKALEELRAIREARKINRYQPPFEYGSATATSQDDNYTVWNAADSDGSA